MKLKEEISMLQSIFRNRHCDCWLYKIVYPYSLLSFLNKDKCKIMRSANCLCMCLYPHINFWANWPTDTKIYVTFIPTEPTPTSYFITSSIRNNNMADAKICKGGHDNAKPMPTARDCSAAAKIRDKYKLLIRNSLHGIVFYIKISATTWGSSSGINLKTCTENS